MKNTKKALTAMLLSSIVLVGCTPTTEDLEADVYGANQLNTQQEVKPVTILAVSPAKVRVPNKRNKKLAQAGGIILGATLGGILGHQHSDSAGWVGGVAGAGAGVNMSDALVRDTVVVPGVGITYRVQGTSKIYQSSQAGKMCQFQKGTALMVRMTARESRIQPNAVCS